MKRIRPVIALAAAALSAATLVTVAEATKTTAPPVGPLPAGPTSTIQTQNGQLVAFALPHRPNGRIWRVARNIDSSVLTQVSEADVGANVVLVFKTIDKGHANLAFALTRGETAKAYEARRFEVNVR